jgi:hypothetical protein
MSNQRTIDIDWQFYKCGGYVLAAFVKQRVTDSCPTMDRDFAIEFREDINLEDLDYSMINVAVKKTYLKRTARRNVSCFIFRYAHMSRIKDILMNGLLMVMHPCPIVPNDYHTRIRSETFLECETVSKIAFPWLTDKPPYPTVINTPLYGEEADAAIKKLREEGRNVSLPPVPSMPDLGGVLQKAEEKTAVVFYQKPLNGEVPDGAAGAGQERFREEGRNVSR